MSENVILTDDSSLKKICSLTSSSSRFLSIVKWPIANQRYHLKMRDTINNDFSTIRYDSLFTEIHFFL